MNYTRHIKPLTEGAHRWIGDSSRTCALGMTGIAHVRAGGGGKYRAFALPLRRRHHLSVGKLSFRACAASEESRTTQEQPIRN